MSRAPERTRVVEERESSWTPVPVPQPLYLSRSLAPAGSMTDMAAGLRLASASAEQAVRASQQDVVAIHTLRAVPDATPSRFARMGIVDDAATAAPDLDAVLARRRAVG